ncbi:hypothetical protein BaOVIS_032730 [Babesia ovis]|uniref:Uncharacterized protein n=1 Tax=Babesia ovis TaxID=5869 RepID=A0A9W5TF94_BABOV|nr:hypothetical protein BaOVIS_032730 [Babesia ovis]
MYGPLHLLALVHILVLLSSVTSVKYLRDASYGHHYKTPGWSYQSHGRQRPLNYGPLRSSGFIASTYSAPSLCNTVGGTVAFENDITHGTSGYTDLLPTGVKRKFSLSLGIKKLRKMKRRKINRMNKDLELFRRVKERRLKNPNRLVDIRKINFRNDKCNPHLMRLPVSPLVDLNGLVPFKTVPEMTSQIPFNPAPVLHTIGYKFKPREQGKYERFCEPYPMDKVLQIIDARSLGAISRMAGKYKITGEGTRIPTPMDSQPVPPGGSVGKGYGFGLSKKPEPKRKPMPLSTFDSYAPDPGMLVDNLDEVDKLRKEAMDYVDKLVKPLMGTPKGSGKRGVRSSGKDVSTRDSTQRGMYDSIPADSVEIPYLDDACTEGDIMRNPRYLGEYRYKYWYHPFYGNASMPGEERKWVEEHNRENPDDPVEYEEYKVDIIYCHSNGTIVYLGENQEPYTNEADNFVMEGEDPTEPRFVIQACAGYIKEEGLQLGQILPQVNSEMRERYFDNYFSMPKSLRKLYKVHLPDGRPLM